MTQVLRLVRTVLPYGHMRAVLFVLSCCAVATLGSCSPPPGPPRPLPVHAVYAPCPLGVVDAKVASEDTDGGIALLFTSTNHRDDLRERTNRAAALHGPFGKQGLGHNGVHQNGNHHGLHAQELPPARASSENTLEGARLTIVPQHPDDLDRLRARVHRRARHMNTRPCQLEPRSER